MTLDQIRAVRTARNCGHSWNRAAKLAGVSYFVARNHFDPRWAARRRRQVNANRARRREEAGAA